MMEFIVGAIAGIAGMIAKDKFFGNGSEQKMVAKEKELKEIYAENEKLYKRSKEMERQIEDLLMDTNKMRKQSQRREDEQDDLADDLQKAKDEVKKLRNQNDDLCLKLQEYKVACEGYELRIAELKDKLS